MLRKRRTKHCSPRTALLAVIFLFAGVALIVGSLWLQESEISVGVNEYSSMANELKMPIKTGGMVDEVLTVRYDPEVDQQLATLFPSTTVCPEVQNPATPASMISTANSVVPDTRADLAACKAVNGDFIAWLQIPGTDVDYPVVLTDDAAYYLKHTFTGEESIIGCLFSLGRTDYEKPSTNIAIYGHHMRRSRSTTMFQPLHNFKKADYRHSHATIYLDTLYGNRTYTVFAVINKRERDWDAAVADFTSMEQYQAFLNRAKEWSLYDTGIPVTTNDRILTLITCDRGYHPDDGQLVVMAVEQ